MSTAVLPSVPPEWRAQSRKTQHSDQMERRRCRCPGSREVLFREQCIEPMDPLIRGKRWGGFAAGALEHPSAEKAESQGLPQKTCIPRDAELSTRKAFSWTGSYVIRGVGAGLIGHLPESPRASCTFPCQHFSSSVSPLGELVHHAEGGVPAVVQTFSRCLLRADRLNTYF